MILDRLENAEAYIGLPKRIRQALEILRETSFDSVEDGTYKIDGDNLYYMVMRYETKPFAEGLLEMHRNYLDVQYVAKGREIMGYMPLDNLTVESPYDAEGDYELFQLAKNTTPLCFEQGMFGIFYPQDAHMPGRHLEVAESVCKVVVKVRIETCISFSKGAGHETITS
jgi:YhcH/YjgK/YiaL family protein